MVFLAPLGTQRQPLFPSNLVEDQASGNGKGNVFWCTSVCGFSPHHLSAQGVLSSYGPALPLLRRRAKWVDPRTLKGRGKLLREKKKNWEEFDRERAGCTVESTVEVKTKVKVIDSEDNEEEGTWPPPYCPSTGMVEGYEGPEGVSEPYTALRRLLRDPDQQGEAAYWGTHS